MKKNKKIIIAIDGYSSTGKSTLAKKIAKKLGYIYVDTGAMYRAVTLYALQNNYFKEGKLNSDELLKNLQKIELEFRYNSDKELSEIYLNDKNIEKEIRSMEVSNVVSIISAISAVRKKLVQQQKMMGEKKGVVMDGRDIGTVVFPNAEIKIFLTAAAENRANRRYKEMINKGLDVKYKEVLHNVTSRDLIDTTREDSPLIKAKDAIEIDNSSLSVEETFIKVYNIVLEKL